MKKNEYKFLSQIAFVSSLFLESYFCSPKSIVNNSEEADVISVDMNNDFNSREMLNSDTFPLNTSPEAESETLKELYDATLPFLYFELNLKQAEKILKDYKNILNTKLNTKIYKDFIKDYKTVVDILNKIKNPAKRFSMLLSAYNHNILATSFLKIYFEYDNNLLNKISFNMKKYLGEDFIENIEKTGIAEKVSKGNFAYSNILNRLAYSTLIFTYIINNKKLFPGFKFINKDFVENLYTFERIQNLIIYKNSIPTNFKTLLLEAKSSWRLLWLLGYVNYKNKHIVDEDFIKCFDYYESYTPRLLGIFRLLTMLSTIPQNTWETVYEEIDIIANSRYLLNQYNKYNPLYEKQNEKLKVLCNMIIRFQKDFPQYINYHINDITDCEYNLREALTNLIFLFVKSVPSDMREGTPMNSPSKKQKASDQGNNSGEKTLKVSPKKDLMPQILDSPVRGDRVKDKSKKVDVEDLSLRKLMVETMDEEMIDVNGETNKNKYDEFYSQIAELTCGELCEFIISYLNNEYGITPLGQAALSYKKVGNELFIRNFSKPEDNTRSMSLKESESFDPKPNPISQEVFSVFDLTHDLYNSHLSNEDKENLLLILTALMSEHSKEEETIFTPFLKYNLSQLKASLYPSLNLDFSDESIKIVKLGKTKLYPFKEDLYVAERYNKEQNLNYTTINEEARNKLLINLNILTKEDRNFFEKKCAEKDVFAILCSNVCKLHNDANKKDFTSFDIHMMLVDAAHINHIPFAMEAWLAIRFNFLTDKQKALLNSLSLLSLAYKGDFGFSREEHKHTVFKILKEEFDILQRNNPRCTSLDVFNILFDFLNIKSSIFAMEAWLVMKEFYDTSNKLLENTTRPKLIQNTSEPLIANDSHNK